jgi:hypothetical protein
VKYIIPKNIEILTAMLNERGGGGWDCFRAYGTDTTIVLFFKRPLPQKDTDG